MFSKIFGVESNSKEWQLNQCWKRITQLTISKSEILLFRVKFYFKDFREYISRKTQNIAFENIRCSARIMNI